MAKYLEFVNSLLWGIPVLLLILAVGVGITVRTGFPQFQFFSAAVKSFLQSFKKGGTADGISPYRALCTALAATVGTGNLAGVAGAIAIGGPGAVFWMWVCAILGMATKFAEAVLSVRYRQTGKDGLFRGGPMYMVKNGMGAKWQFLAGFYCFFGVVAAFGVGSATQVNAVLGGIHGVMTMLGAHGSKLLDLLIGIAIAVSICFATLGGVKRIGAISAFIVPFASVFYILLCFGVLITRASALPGVFSAIVEGAFNPKSVTGGVVGSAFLSLRIGASRGVFSNEAGMGTAAIAHASANVVHPVQQGFMGILEVFIDTIVICTMTALTILLSGIRIPYGKDHGIQITVDALSSVYGSWVSVPIAISLVCFAVATMLGWGLYGMRCAQYLFGENAWKRFAVVQSISIVIGAVLSTGTVWTLSEIANGLMAIPNLIILTNLMPELIRLTSEYKRFYFEDNKRRYK